MVTRLRSLLSYLMGHPSPYTRRSDGTLRLRVELLEDRHLLSANPVADPGTPLEGSIHGTVWNDAFGDGFRDGESGRGGIAVFLDQNQNGLLDFGETSTTTERDGTFSIPGLTAGTYTVAIEKPNGFDITSPNANKQGFVSLRRLATGFSAPVFVAAPAGDVHRLFIVEKNSGNVQILNLTTGLVEPTPFLTVPNLSTDGERGLLGLAFDPDYSLNGYFYVYFTDLSGTSNVVRYQTSADSNLADVNSALTLLKIPQPGSGHNGGWMGFGSDGHLYIAVGDGGGGNDPENNAQDTTDNLLGKMLRIDPRTDAFPNDLERNYAVPADNPFVGVPGDDEIWSIGLRNPWRNSFDRQTGDLYIADVGQGAREEVNFQPADTLGGENYGWRLREGTIATPTAGIGGPPPPGAVDPLYDYQHGGSEFQGSSVTGGYVYRGSIQFLQGLYFFGDFIVPRIWSLEHDGNSVIDRLDWSTSLTPDVGTVNNLVSFGEGGDGEVYILDFDGDLFQLEATGLPGAHMATVEPGAVLSGLDFGLHNSTEIEVDNSDTSLVSILGPWSSSVAVSGFQGVDYLIDRDRGQGSTSVAYTPPLTTSGQYEVFLKWTSANNRASNVPVDIVHSGGTTTVVLDQRIDGEQWQLMGTFNFQSNGLAQIRIRTDGADGFVISDAVRFVKTQDAGDLTATLAFPTANGSTLDKELNTSGYIDVSFAAGSGSDLDEASITDTETEFTLSGSAADNVVVDGAATRVDGNTFRYLFTGSFGLGKVTVDFLFDTWQDLAGNLNVSTSESLELLSIIDNLDTQVSVAGSWGSSTASPGFEGVDYFHDQNSAKGSKWLTFTPGLTRDGLYDIFLRWTSFSNRASNVPVDIIHAGGTTTVTVDQRNNGGRWNLLGTFNLRSNGSSEVKIRTDGTDGYVVADAIRVTQTDTTRLPYGNLKDPVNGSQIEVADINSRGYLDVTFIGRQSGLDSLSITDPAAEFTLSGQAAAGVTVDGAATQIDPSTYRYAFTGNFGIGKVDVNFLLDSWKDQSGNRNESEVESFDIFSVIDNQSSQVSIHGTWSSSVAAPGFEGADYLHDQNNGKGNKSVTFTPVLEESGQYALYLRWTSFNNRASNVPVDIVHAGGITTVTVDQRSNGGVWNLLGTFELLNDGSNSIRIRTDGTDGYVIVDALRLVRI